MISGYSNTISPDGAGRSVGNSGVFGAVVAASSIPAMIEWAT